MLAGRLYHQSNMRRSLQSKREASRLKTAIDAYVASNFSNEKYLELFADHHIGWFSQNRSGIKGDMSTDYCLLELDEIEQIKSVLPTLPVMMIVRNPVERLWSAFNMFLRRRERSVGNKTPENFDEEIEGEATIENLESFCARPHILRSSMASRTYSNWSTFFDGIHVISFEDIRRDPKKVIAQAASVAAGRKITLPADFELANNKERLAKAKMLPPHRAFLYEHLSEEMVRCKDVFPTIAADWPEK